MVKIVQKEDEILRQIAKDVAADEIGTNKLNKIIEDMKEALASQDDGVAIAAPQIGVPLRIFVVSGRIIAYIKGQDEKTHHYPDQVYINPKITKLSKEKHIVEEGCLSIRYLYGKVKRSKKASIEALNENGEKIRKGASGIMAQIFQHETDHLEGVLFTDFATNLEEIPPEEMATRSRSHKDV